MSLTQEHRSQGGLASHRAWKQRQALQAVERAELDALLRWCDRENLAPSFVAGSLRLAVAGASGVIEPPTTPGERLKLIEAAQALHKMARLELGESTANTITASLDIDALAARLDRLKAAQADTTHVDVKPTPPT